MGDCIKCKDDKADKPPCAICSLAKRCADRIEHLTLRNKLLTGLLAEAMKHVKDDAGFKAYVDTVLASTKEVQDEETKQGTN